MIACVMQILLINYARDGIALMNDDEFDEKKKLHYSFPKNGIDIVL